MRQVGRPRRSEEQPDSEFGELLKEYIHRVKNFTQAELSWESGVAAKTISEMVKGKRTTGSELQSDLRKIIKALHQKKALLTLTEANGLMTAIPKIAPLDERDAEDKAIIDLFAPPAADIPITTKGSEHQNDEDIVPASNASSEVVMMPSLVEPPAVTTASDDAPSISINPEPVETPVPPSDVHSSPVTGEPAIPAPVEIPEIIPPPVPPVRGLGQMTQRQLWRYVSVGLALLVAIGLVLALLHEMLSVQAGSCSATTSGVTLYADTNDQGQCHTFGVGDFALARFGLAQNVSSIRNPNDAYHIILYDKAKNFYYVDKDMPILPAEWDKRADEIHIEKHRPTSCQPGSNGIIAFIDPDYAGGCLFITHDIPDLTPLNFDSVLVSLQFVGGYHNTKQLVIYRKPNYQDQCGTYWQDQSDLEQCARLALSVRVLPFVPPTPVPTLVGTHYAGNVASQATLSPAGAGAVVDGSLQTEWVGGHMIELDLSWPFPVTVYRVVVWDRKQSSADNNQINKLKLLFSDGAATGSLDMVSGGPRCVDVIVPQQTITWLHIVPVDASGNNGYREVEVWATTGPQYSDNTCVNKHVIVQTLAQ